MTASGRTKSAVVCPCLARHDLGVNGAHRSTTDGTLSAQVSRLASAAHPLAWSGRVRRLSSDRLSSGLAAPHYRASKRRLGCDLRTPDVGADPQPATRARQNRPCPRSNSLFCAHQPRFHLRQLPLQSGGSGASGGGHAPCHCGWGGWRPGGPEGFGLAVLRRLSSAGRSPYAVFGRAGPGRQR